MATGVVTWFGTKGYGFIEQDTGGPDIFCHLAALMPGERRPVEGDRVEFEIETALHGKTRAVRVRVR